MQIMTICLANSALHNVYLCTRSQIEIYIYIKYANNDNLSGQLSTP
jgi:hypothetical protein